MKKGIYMRLVSTDTKLFNIDFNGYNIFDQWS